MNISKVTRRNITDALRINNISWSGRLEETEFLSRIYDLSKLPSYDGRFRDAAGDIWQHRINNYDWDDDWVFSDGRFQLADGPDDVFLRFCCEMIHPLVRPDQEEVQTILSLLNEHLRGDGWEIAKVTEISGLPVFSARQLIEGAEFHLETAEKVAKELGTDYISQQITRLRLSVDSDPELAIGQAKEFVETVCKTILGECSVSSKGADDFPKLVKATIKELKLAPDDIPDHAKASKTIKVLLSNLGTVSQGLAELRNPYGSGHGKDAKHSGLLPRHARLAVGSAVTLATFLHDTHRER